jgi:hypothetical protein
MPPAHFEFSLSGGLSRATSAAHVARQSCACRAGAWSIGQRCRFNISAGRISCAEDKHPVSAVTKELYASPNGDRWYLARCGDSGRVFVRHVANPASGGKETTIELGEFLSRPGNPPEKQALVRLVGSLIQAPHGSGAPANSN